MPAKGDYRIDIGTRTQGDRILSVVEIFYEGKPLQQLTSRKTFENEQAAVDAGEACAQRIISNMREIGTVSNYERGVIQ